MRIALFYHSLVSDWNHGNAHFLRGVAAELIGRGHEVRVFEPRDGWSLCNLIREQGLGVIDRFREVYPGLQSTFYDPAMFDRADLRDVLDEALEGVDLVVVHEWNPPELVGRVGAHRAGGGRYRLLFHDTHHRSVTAPEEMARYNLTHYDGVLAYGRVIRDLYLSRGWAARAWTWHEAADVRRFHPRKADREGDLVWIGNWGDGERTAELETFLLEPVRALGLSARVYGVRYPEAGRAALADAGIHYG